MVNSAYSLGFADAHRRGGTFVVVVGCVVVVAPGTGPADDNHSPAESASQGSAQGDQGQDEGDTGTGFFSICLGQRAS